MKTRDCPRCRRKALFQTGAFWACGICSYAITQAALLIDQADARGGNRRAQMDSLQDNHSLATTLEMILPRQAKLSMRTDTDRETMSSPLRQTLSH